MERDCRWTSARSDEDGDGVALRLVDRLCDVARILAVDLERERLVTADDEAVEVVSEARVRDEVERHGAGIRVGRAVRDERERRTAEPLELEPRLEADMALRKRAERHA